MKGFFNSILHVNLDDGKTRITEVGARVYKSWLGGKGLATYLLLRCLKPGVDPFSRENVLIFTPGIAAGSVPGTSRYSVHSRSPLTMGYGESYSGGSLAPAFKATGHDALVITGRSSRPVYIVVTPGMASLEDASSLWGLSTYEAEASVLKEVGEKKARALTIGPAGENQVRFASIGNDYWRNAGRGGLGAVMGSKKVKAIVFHGDEKVEWGRPEEVRDFSRELRKKGVKNPGVKGFRKYGTLKMARVLNHLHGFPSRYWSRGSTEHIEEISADYLVKEMDARPKACHNCFIACGKLVKVKKGPHRGLEIEGPEYETVFAFGGLCSISSLEEIAHLNDLCDRFGMDTITTGSLVALVMEAGRRGLLEPRLKYGDAEGAENLIRDIAEKRNLGAVLAEGTKKASAKLGVSDLSIHVKGLDLPGYDPRLLRGMALAYGTSSRGACHLRTTYYVAELSGRSPDNPRDKVKDFMDYEDRLTLLDSIIMCKFYRDLIPWGDMKKCIAALTGVDYTLEHLRDIAGRIATAARVFNHREGFRARDDALPERLYKENVNDKALTKEEYQKMLREYYLLRGWSEEGIPKKR
jgi:aldehyde:ferredoxin oxidoreductase